LLPTPTEKDRSSAEGGASASYSPADDHDVDLFIRHSLQMTLALLGVEPVGRHHSTVTPPN